ncbi:uncharacterized protein LOC130941874 [Arachis stenosperma]|uniref:uncharacterized protein LOC107608169 n=1 Tax=Arachis ipaensis TaxID=130454 RepID=UPI0007AF6DB6|nr:uncharacterized protein LOC107608169 [Arachis ipaensis]XP_025668911.1 uncharacterized protein LOC112767243 [Arachis hypogaea]XP_057726484.1 uncharacterized protein LOC130941874 [Arachis stenosperma]QHN91103.1 Transmembrane protein, putative [Arachis hypogaea]
MEDSNNKNKKISSSSSKKLWLKKLVKKELWQFTRLFSCASFRGWKRLDIQTTVVDTVVFKILSAVEAVVLVSTLCFFYLCCGCNF